MTHTVQFSSSTVVVASPRQISSKIGGEVVILELDNGTYFGLDEVGVVIWQLVQQPRSVAEIRDAILRQFDVTPDRCESDLVALLAEMLQERLVEVSA